MNKVISIVITVCFLISFVAGPTMANALSAADATAQYKQIFSNFVLPYSFGQITSAHYGATDRVLINIQDLHSHPKVQKNISNIIELFDKKYGVNKVFLEGAYGQVSTKWIDEKTNKRNKNKILDMMLETGRLTGAEYYSAKSDKTEIIEGLEKKEPYLDNLKRFGQLLEEQEKIEEILKAISESTKELKEKYYGKRQKKIEKLSQDYRDNKITSKKYYTLLAKHIDKLGIDINKYENTLAYIMLLELQKGLDYSKITRELQNLVYVLKGQLPYNAYKKLLEHTDNFTRTDSLYAYIIQIARIYNLDLSVNFSNLDKYFRYIELSQKINPIELIAEEDRLRHEINTRFSETKAQRDVVFLTDFEKYLRDYITTKITSGDYQYYKENIEDYKTLYNKYVDNRVLSLLDAYMKEVDNFYEINNDRNIYFTDSLFAASSSSLSSPSASVGDLSLSSLRGDVSTKQSTARSAVIADSDPQSMLNKKTLSPVIASETMSSVAIQSLSSDNSQPSALSSSAAVNQILDNMKDVKTVDIVITGGFHSQTVTDILKDHGVSYIVITPNVTDGVKLAEETYHNIVKEQSRISFQTLASLISSLSIVDQIKILKMAGITDEELNGIYSPQQLEEASREGQKASPMLDAITPKVMELAGLLESDEFGDIKERTIKILKDRVGQEQKEIVNEELLNKIDTEKLKGLLEDKDITKLQKVITTVSKDSVVRQAADIIIDMAETVQKYSVTIQAAKISAEIVTPFVEQEQEETSQSDQKTISLINLTNLDESIKESGIEELFEENGMNFRESCQVKTFEEFFTEKLDELGTEEVVPSEYAKNLENFLETCKGFSLGLSSYIEKRMRYDLSVVFAVSQALNLCTWQPYFKYYDKYKGISIRNINDHLTYLIEDCKKFDKKIYMFVPSELLSMDKEEIKKRNDKFFEDNPDLAQYRRDAIESVTLSEVKWLMEYLKQHPEDTKYVEFVFGAYDYLNIPNEQFFAENLKDEMSEKEIVKLAELYRKIFAKTIDLEQSVDKVFEEKIGLIQDILEEYKRFFKKGVVDEFFANMLKGFLEQKKVEEVKRFFNFLQNLDGNYNAKRISILHRQYFSLAEKTEDDDLIMDRILNKISAQTFNDAVAVQAEIKPVSEPALEQTLEQIVPQEDQITKETSSPQEQEFFGEVTEQKTESPAKTTSATQTKQQISIKKIIAGILNTLSMMLLGAKIFIRKNIYRIAEVFKKPQTMDENSKLEARTMYMNDSQIERVQQILDELFALNIVFPENIKKQLSETFVMILEDYFNVVKELAKYDIKITDIHNDLYRFLNEGMNSNIAISIFEPYCKGKISLTQLQKDINKIDVLIRWFITYQNKKSSNNSWIADTNFNLLEKDKDFVNRVYSIGKILDEFVKKNNIEVSYYDYRTVSDYLSEAFLFVDNDRDKDIIKIMEDFLSGELPARQIHSKIEELVLDNNVVSGIKFSFFNLAQAEFVKKFIPIIQNFDEKEVSFLKDITDKFLVSTIFYEHQNDDILITMNLLNKINRKNLNVFIENNFSVTSSVEAELFLEILSADIDINEGNIELIKDLIKDMKERDLHHLALENNALSLKVFFNPVFRNKFKNYPFSIQYRNAIKIARFMVLSGVQVSLIEQNLSALLPKAIEIEARIIDKAGEKIFIGKNTKILLGNNNEKSDERKLGDGTHRFTADIYKKMLKQIGFTDREIEEHLNIYEEPAEGNDKEKEEKLKESIYELLGEISKFRYEEGKNENLLVVFNGHGGNGTWWYSATDYINLNTEIAIAIDILIKDMRKEGKSEEEIQNTIEHITLDLSCCHSYVTAGLIKKELVNFGIKYCPQIVSEAGKEIVFGYTLGEGGNLEQSIISYLNNNPDKREITLKDIFYSEIISSNHTIFMVDDSVSFLFDEFVSFISDFQKNMVTSEESTVEGKDFSDTEIVPSYISVKFMEMFENENYGSFPVELTSKSTEDALKFLRVNKRSVLGKIIIGKLENWRIVLGIFFPGIRDKFISEHETDVSKELDELVGSIGVLKYAAEHVPTNKIVKNLMALSVLLNPLARIQLAKAHTAWNLQELKETTIEIAVKAAKETVSPVEILQEASAKLATGMDRETAMVDGKQESMVVTEYEEEAIDLISKGIKAVVVRSTVEDSRGNGAGQIENYKGIPVRVEIRTNENGVQELVFKINQESHPEINIADIDVYNELVPLLSSTIDSNEEGRKDIKGFEGITRVVSSSNTEGINKIKNEKTSAITLPGKDFKQDMTKRKDVKKGSLSNICARESEATDSKIFILTAEQANECRQEIENLQNNGYRFIINYDKSSDVSEIMFDGAKINAEDINSVEKAKEFLRKLQELKLSKGIDIQISVRFSDKIYSDLNMDIFNEYGIIPIADIGMSEKITGKKEIEDTIDEKKFENMLRDDNVVSIVIDEDSKEFISKNKDKIRQAKSALTKYKKGANAAQSSKFDYTANTGRLMNIINSGILSADLEKAQTEIEKLNFTLFSPDAQTYLEYLQSKERYEEMLGFVRGVVLRTVAQEITKLETINIEKEDFLAAEMNNTVQAILIMTVQQMANGKTLESLFTQVGGSDVMTAEEYLNSIRSTLNGAMDEVLRKNETKIDTSTEALMPFDGIPELLMDSYRPRSSVGKDINISIFAVKSMLSAA